MGRPPFRIKVVEMDRRTFLKAGASAAAVPLMKNAARAENSSPRQVIVILGESVRADMLNCYRHTGIQTPNLDRLASEGIRFTKAYDCQPVCAAARSAIWTGLYPHTNGVRGNSMPLTTLVHTVAQRLHDQGIHCGYVGKWHVDGFDYFGTGHPAPGWDPAYWYDMRDYLMELTPEERVLSRKPSSEQSPGWPLDRCYAYRSTNRAIKFVSQNREQDYLFVLAFDEPHPPSLCPRKYAEMYRDFAFPMSPNMSDPLTNKPEEQRIWADGELRKKARPFRDPQFFGAHTFVDDQIGRLLKEIGKSAPNALVIYTADHGIFMRAHRLTNKGPAMYDEITRIPFLVRWPGQAPAGAVCNHPVSHIDISGTIMDYFGLAVPPTLQGTTMLKTFRNPEVAPRSEVYLEFTRYAVNADGFGGYQPIRCVFDGRYKLAVHLLSSDELYDVRSDPGEMTNLIDSPDHKKIRNGLHDKLLQWMGESRDPARGYYWGRRPWRPDFPVTWRNAGMRRQRASDGYLPRELDYSTGLPMKSLTEKE